MTLPARLSIVTLGVADLAGSIAFYEALGWQRKSASIEGAIAWFGTADSTIGLFPWDELAHDANDVLPPTADARVGDAGQSFQTFSLAIPARPVALRRSTTSCASSTSHA